MATATFIRRNATYRVTGSAGRNTSSSDYWCFNCQCAIRRGGELFNIVKLNGSKEIRRPDLVCYVCAGITSVDEVL